MKLTLAFAAAAALAFTMPTAAQAQAGSKSNIVSLYHVAPGHQLMFLKWLAEQNRIAAAAGVGPSQLYVHTDGDSWDYMVIAPQTTPAQDDAADAAAKKMGLMSGPMVSIELRKHLSSHTDTMVQGPMTASEFLGQLGER